jgi:hypothetical protein
VDIGMLLISFVLGIILGFLVSIGVILYLGKKSLSKKLENKLESVKKATKQIESVSERMKKVKEITNEQLGMQARATMPQKNGLDGKYKNGLISEIKRLEQEKHEILKSILKDGFDLEITTIDETGVVTSMKLSQFMADQGIVFSKEETIKEKTIKEETIKEVKTKQVGKFTIIKGGKTSH